MKIVLNHIADVSTGVTLKQKPTPAAHAKENVLLMQLGDLDIEGNIQIRSLMPTAPQALFQKFIVKPGDLVFRGRGAGMVAAVIPETDIPVVAASPLMIIRPNIKKVDPQYLAWALTNDNARRYYAEHSRGSSITGIGKRDLDLLEIELPILDVQRKIAELKNLETQEHELLLRYQQKKSKLVELLITDVIHKENAA